MINKKHLKETALGGILQNPIFVLVLGICPSIGASTTLANSFAMGLATMFVLVCSNVVISLLRRLIPDRVRLPVYIVMIATFVTVVQLFMDKYTPDLYLQLGGFISLIVVNCIILARAEAYASKNSVVLSLVDGLSMGLGFLLALCILGGTRQFLAEVLRMQIFSKAAGGFIVLGLLMALFNFLYLYGEGLAIKYKPAYTAWWQKRTEEKKQRKEKAAEEKRRIQEEKAEQRRIAEEEKAEQRKIAEEEKRRIQEEKAARIETERIKDDEPKAHEELEPLAAGEREEE